ncbi:phosphoglycerate dehydrogenase [Liquorilactobacillus satsumensis]|uniref:phosphoglycerate dehydrogenase n=2 Tax=Liquorilactobacillus satsumensis TaxID=259059 RepID=UPI002A1329CC|nr:phosphoglycerate dehydrogenase [Liquorilactobacillus satsumensis]MCP9370849.1 phosphoglycerate dehydrogenase [Liquorilactobacillus satsumensis]
MKVLITPRGFANNGLDQIRRMEDKGLSVDYNDTGLQYSSQTFLNKARNSDAIIVGVDKIDKNIIDSCPNLKVICKFGVGTDNIDMDYAKRKKIIVCKTIGSNSNAVAEHVMALIYCWSKNLYTTINSVKKSSWTKLTGTEIRGKTLGILGFGEIGKQLARQADGIGMNVLVNDVCKIPIEIVNKYHVKEVSKNDIYRNADYISLHLPLLDTTKNMISTQQLKEMKKSAVLVNAARGGIVDEKALYVALKNHEIQAACFDVFSVEPPAQNEPLLKLSNFLLTSHTAARTVEADQRTCVISTNAVLKHLRII